MYSLVSILVPIATAVVLPCIIVWIAYNTFISCQRNRKITEAISMANDIACTESSDKSFEYQNLYMALDRLSDKERTSILLYYMQGYAIDEIAEITEASKDAVKQHLSRGRQHLKSLLTGD